jgi:hypothetical protein
MVALHYIARLALVFTGGEQISDVNCTGYVPEPARRQLLVVGRSRFIVVLLQWSREVVVTAAWRTYLIPAQNLTPRLYSW